MEGWETRIEKKVACLMCMQHKLKDIRNKFNCHDMVLY